MHFCILTTRIIINPGELFVAVGKKVFGGYCRNFHGVRQAGLAGEQRSGDMETYNPTVAGAALLPQSIRKLAESDASFGALLGVTRKVIEAYKLTLRMDSPRS